jgi:hypothetical protein
MRHHGNVNVNINTTMQQTQEIVGLSQVERVTLFSTTVKSHTSTQKTAAKIAVAMIIAGDATDDNLGAFVQKHCGIEIRSEVQGVYQAIKVLRAILDGKIENATEADFDRIGWTACQELSRFMNPKSLLNKHLEDANKAFLGDQPVSALKKLAKTINEEKPLVETTSVETTQTVSLVEPIVEAIAEPIAELTLLDHIAAINTQIENETDSKNLAAIQQSLYLLIEAAEAKIQAAPEVEAARNAA